MSNLPDNPLVFLHLIIHNVEPSVFIRLDPRVEIYQLHLKNLCPLTFAAHSCRMVPHFSPILIAKHTTLSDYSHAIWFAGAVSQILQVDLNRLRLSLVFELSPWGIFII